MRSKTLLAAILLAACAAGARAAAIALKDGSLLRGNVVGQTMDGVELATPDGTLHVGLDRILRIDYVEPPPLGLPLGETSPAPPIGVTHEGVPQHGNPSGSPGPRPDRRRGGRVGQCGCAQPLQAVPRPPRPRPTVG